MSREVDTCMLSAFLAATRTKPEEQATAVLACALQTSTTLAHAFLVRLGVGGEGEVSVATEVATGTQRDRIDIEIERTNARGGMLGRTWVEVKVTALLAETVRAPNGKVAKEPQLVRYRSALDERDHARPDLGRSALGLLVPEATASDRRQATLTNSKIILWQEVGEIAADCARSITGSDWRLRAREPDASLELANLETLIWFLECADRPALEGRTEFVGIDRVTEPVTPDVATHFANAHRAFLAVEGLVERAAELLTQRGWSVIQDEDDEDSADVEDKVGGMSDEEWELFDALTPAVYLAPDHDDAWWSVTNGEVYLQIRPFDDAERIRTERPIAQVGLSFPGEAGPRLSPAWLEQLDVCGFAVIEHPKASVLSGIWKTRPLAELYETESPAKQAEDLATWASTSLQQLMDLPPGQ